jgi:fructosamine-3-kinase
MNGLPAGLAAALETALGCRLQDVVALSGGMINRSARITTNAGAIFVKWRPDAPPDFFAAEADGLERLRASGAFRVPAVLAWQDRPESGEPTGSPPFLALEYLASQEPVDPRQFATHFGEALADLHGRVVAPDRMFGLERDNFIGFLPQANAQQSDWATFYRDRRLLPQIALARKAGLLPTGRERLLMQLLDRLDSLLGGHAPQPALLHGDLWSGNFLPLNQDVALIDPAVYYGDREMEIAYIELFGGFPAGFMAAYRAAYPLEAGYEDRRSLHQLYPLLNHLNHFGETYGPAVDSVCRHYVNR